MRTTSTSSKPELVQRRRKTTARLPEVEFAQNNIDYSHRLRQLMIIQRKAEDGFETVYRGSRADYTRAGLPPRLLDQPTTCTAYAFRLNGRDAELVRKGESFEL